MSLQHGSSNVNTTQYAQHQACGSIIDAQGREIPITEQMIQKACKELEETRDDKIHQA